MSKPSWIGQTLAGRYKIDELLGQGGMSAVYRAEDPNLRRVVAVKLIHTHLSDRPEFVRRFEEEAAAVAQLRHPHIIQVYDFTHDNDVYFIVFEFVPGESLHDQLKRLRKDGRNMGVDQILKTATQIGEALSYAHKRSLIHRDIKPANVMLNVQGDAILMDFGIVKIVGSEQHTATGAVLGTARYMPPEQIRGERIDERADIYSFGVMLFEMVTGRVPFEADSAMTMMMMHMNDPIPDLSQMRSDVPQGLAAIIRRAMAKQQVDRYQKIDELLADLRALQRGQPVGAATMQERPPAGGATVLEQQQPERTFIEAAGPPVGATYVEQSPAAATAAPMAATNVPAAGTMGAGAGAMAPVEADSGGRSRVFAIGCGALLVLAICLGAVGVLFRTQIMEFAGLATAAAPTPIVEVDVAATTAAAAAATVEAGVIEVETPLTATTAPVDEVPQATTTPTEEPTPTEPVGESVLIDSITVANARYIVNFTATGYEPDIPGKHMHFFFNTVPVEEAGVPGPGNWFIWAEPSPFDGYAVPDTPNGATEMCVLVANQDHTVAPGSGNCVPLPAPPPTSTPPPPPPTATTAPQPAGPSVRINGISVDNGRLIVPYTTTGYQPALPGMHIHFFFNTVPFADAGVPGPGNWFVWGGPSPFNGYTTGDIPGGATQLCALVANANHSIILNSGNCFPLP